MWSSIAHQDVDITKYSLGVCTVLNHVIELSTILELLCHYSNYVTRVTKKLILCNYINYAFHCVIALGNVVDRSIGARGMRMSNQNPAITPRDLFSTNQNPAITQRDLLSTNQNSAIMPRDLFATNHWEVQSSYGVNYFVPHCRAVS